MAAFVKVPPRAVSQSSLYLDRIIIGVSGDLLITS